MSHEKCKDDTNVKKPRFHSPQPQRKNYDKPKLPRKPADLKLIIPPTKQPVHPRPTTPNVSTGNESAIQRGLGLVFKTDLPKTDMDTHKPRLHSSRHSTKFGNDLGSRRFPKENLTSREKRPTKMTKGKQNIKKNNSRRSWQNNMINGQFDKHEKIELHPFTKQSSIALTEVQMNGKDDIDNEKEKISDSQRDVNKRAHYPDKNKLATSRSLDDSLRKIGCTEDKVSERGNTSSDKLLVPHRKAPTPPNARHRRNKSDTQVDLGNLTLHNPGQDKEIKKRVVSSGSSNEVKNQDNSNKKIATEIPVGSQTLKPRRSAPRPPRAKHKRTKSDTQVDLADLVKNSKPGKTRTERITAQSGFTYDLLTVDGPDNSQFPGKSKHRYFTPQPTRRTFLTKSQSFGKGDGSQKEHSHYGIAPIERKALQRNASFNPEPTSPKISPEIKQRPTTPVSPLASSVNDVVLQMPNGRTVTLPHHRHHSIASSEGNSSEGDDFSLESSEGFTIVSYKRREDRRQKHRSLPSIQNKFKDSNPGLGLQFSTGGIRKARNRPQSTPITRFKATNARPPSVIGISPSRAAPKRVDGLREALLRDAANRNLQASHLPITYKERIQIKQTTLAVKETTDTSLKQHQAHQGEDEPDFASLEDLTNNDNTNLREESVDSNDVSPTSTTDNLHRPSLRRAGSLSSLVSVPVSLISNHKMFKDIFLSHRYHHKGVKRVVGFVVGLILGLVLYLLLIYGLKYPQLAAIIITAVSTLFMTISLTFTVWARCVAAMMVPTLCTSKGRAALYAIVIASMLAGPVHNIYENANEVSNSMSCSAELAYNQSVRIRQASQEVVNSYIRGLINSVEKLEIATQRIDEIFEPINAQIELLQTAAELVGSTLQDAIVACDEVIGAAYEDCRGTLSEAYASCRSALDPGAARKRRSAMYEAIHQRSKRRGISVVCEALNIGEVCQILNIQSICHFPGAIRGSLDDTIGRTLDGISKLKDQVAVDIEFDTDWENEAELNGSSQDIQDAIQHELQRSLDVVETTFSVADKIIALSLLWLFLRSYNYLHKYRAKDSFDNFYITDKFRELDNRRKKEGKQYLFPLKKTEKRRLIDRGSMRLSRPEKGLFKIGLSTVFAHIIIAVIVILVDYALYALMEIIRKHGEVEYTISSQGGTYLDVRGEGFVARIISDFFIEEFKAMGNFNTTVNTNICLPQGTAPNEAFVIGIGFVYAFTLLSVLFQAYTLRLRSIIAAMYYPEREMERIIYLYNNTLQRRQNLFKLLRRYIKSKKRKDDKVRNISFQAYFISKYPKYRNLMKFLGFYHPVCQGCKEKDSGDFRRCCDPACGLLYCEECCKIIGNVCVCEEFIDEKGPSIKSKLSYKK